MILSIGPRATAEREDGQRENFRRVGLSGPTTTSAAGPDAHLVNGSLRTRRLHVSYATGRRRTLADGALGFGPELKALKL